MEKQYMLRITTFAMAAFASTKYEIRVVEKRNNNLELVNANVCNFQQFEAITRFVAGTGDRQVSINP